MWVSSYEVYSNQGCGKWFAVMKSVSSNHLREMCQHPRDLPFYYLTKTQSIFSPSLIHQILLPSTPLWPGACWGGWWQEPAAALEVHSTGCHKSGQSSSLPNLFSSPDS